MSVIQLVPLGPLPRGRLDLLQASLGHLLHLEVTQSREEIPVVDVFDPRRDQYRSDLLIEHLGSVFRAETRVLGVTEHDLFIPVLTFVFGEAQLAGRIAVVSSYRLRNEVYGLPEDKPLLEDRLVKEAMHELGHTFGLLHCHNPVCVMQQSTYAEMVDLKPATYCEACREQYETFVSKRLREGTPTLPQTPLR
jgi:archaemetzincin